MDKPPLITWILLAAFLVAPKTGQYPTQNRQEVSDLVLINGNSVLARCPTQVQVIKRSYASLVSPLKVKDDIFEDLMSKIIQCESGGDPTAKNPNSTAYGLCQFLDGTWEYVQNKWDMELDRDSPEDQLYACERLLKEEELTHWQAISECLNNGKNKQ